MRTRWFRTFDGHRILIQIPDSVTPEREASLLPLAVERALSQLAGREVKFAHCAEEA